MTYCNSNVTVKKHKKGSGNGSARVLCNDSKALTWAHRACLHACAAWIICSCMQLGVHVHAFMFMCAHTCMHSCMRTHNMNTCMRSCVHVSPGGTCLLCPCPSSPASEGSSPHDSGCTPGGQTRVWVGGAVGDRGCCFVLGVLVLSAVVAYSSR